MPLERRLDRLKVLNEEPDDEDSDSENLIPLFAEDEQDKPENEDLHDDSASIQHTGNDASEITLDSFRKEWKSELDSRLKDPIESQVQNEATHEQQLQDAATKLFLEGVDCERRGDMWEAVQRYMGAVRMVPDIEKKVYIDRSSSIPQNFSATDLICMGSDDRQRSRSRSRFRLPEVGDLGNILQQRIADRGKLFEPEFPDQSCPIVTLPVELLSALMRYVVGSELDVRCLELLSATSAGFYLLARDEELWHTICRQTFSAKHVDSVRLDTFTSWRQMYVTYPHVYFHGVYIGKTTYLRNGESSFQQCCGSAKLYSDLTEELLHLFSDSGCSSERRFVAVGTVIMTTTPDPPAQIVGFLKPKTPRLPGVLIGHYWIVEQNCIRAQFHRRCEKSVQRPRRSHKLRHQFVPYEIVDQRFDMKLHFGDGKKRREHCVLQLEEYDCTVTYLDGNVSRSSLDTSDHQAYPPLFFSRVKSYAIPDGWDEILK